MGDTTASAAALVVALADAHRRLGDAAYDIWVADTSAHWQRVAQYGGRDGTPSTIVGYLLTLPDARALEASVTVTVAAGGAELTVEADATVEAEPPENLEWLLELPAVTTSSLSACVDLIRSYTDQLVAATPRLAAQARALGPLEPA